MAGDLASPFNRLGQALSHSGGGPPRMMISPLRRSFWDGWRFDSIYLVFICLRDLHVLPRLFCTFPGFPTGFPTGCPTFVHFSAPKIPGFPPGARVSWPPRGASATGAELATNEAFGEDGGKRPCIHHRGGVPLCAVSPTSLMMVKKMVN